MLSLDREHIRQIGQRLEAAGFRATRSDDWYLCVAVSMVWRPGTQREIVETAGGIVAETLGWTGDRRECHPCWHFGNGAVRGYFERLAQDPPEIGGNLTFDDLEPFCADHNVSWRDSRSCSAACRYSLRLNDRETTPRAA